jgi:hypothetical protein
LDAKQYYEFWSTNCRWCKNDKQCEEQKQKKSGEKDEKRPAQKCEFEEAE